MVHDHSRSGGGAPAPTPLPLQGDEPSVSLGLYEWAVVSLFVCLPNGCDLESDFLARTASLELRLKVEKDLLPLFLLPGATTTTTTTTAATATTTETAASTTTTMTTETRR